MGIVEDLALGKVDGVEHCPACQDAGRGLKSFTTLTWPDSPPEAWMGSIKAGDAPSEVACAVGHRYRIAAQIRTRWSEKFVLAERLPTRRRRP